MSAFGETHQTAKNNDNYVKDYGHLELGEKKGKIKKFTIEASQEYEKIK